MALGVVDAEFGNEFTRGFAFDVLSDGFELHDFRNLRNGSDHRFGDSVVRDIANKTAIYLQRVNIKVLEIGKRTKACAKVVEGYAAAMRAQGIDECFNSSSMNSRMSSSLSD